MNRSIETQLPKIDLSREVRCRNAPRRGVADLLPDMARTRAFPDVPCFRAAAA